MKRNLMTKTQMDLKMCFKKKLADLIPYSEWIIEHKKIEHFIDTYFVIDLILNVKGKREQENILNKLSSMDIDLVDGYFKKLATEYVTTSY